MRKGFFLILFIAVLIVACKRSRVPEGIMPPEKMENVLWDIIQADEFAKGYVLPFDSTLNDTTEMLKLYKKTFAFNKTTREEFEKSFAYYRTNNTLMKEVLDSLNARAQRAPTELAKPLPVIDTVAIKDSADRRVSPPSPPNDTPRKSKRIREVLPVVQ